MSRIREQIEREKVWLNSLLKRTSLDEDELEIVGKELAQMYFEREDLKNEVIRLKNSAPLRSAKTNSG